MEGIHLHEDDKRFDSGDRGRYTVVENRGEGV